MPDRIDFDLTSTGQEHLAERPGRTRCRRPLPLWRAGRRSRSRRRRDGRGRRRSAPALPATSSASPTKRPSPRSRRSKTCRTTDAQGKASFPVNLDKPPSSTHPLEAQISVRMAEPGGRAVEHKITLPVTPARQHDRRQAAVLAAARSPTAPAPISTSFSSRPTARRSRRAGCTIELLRIDTHYQLYKRDGALEFRAGQDDDAGRRRRPSTPPPTSRRAFRCR